MMRVNFDAVIQDLGGNPLVIDGTSMSLGYVAVNALLAAHADDAGLSGTEKVRRFKLAQTIHGGGEIIIDVEEVALIKQLIARQFVTLVAGRALLLLEG